MATEITAVNNITDIWMILQTSPNDNSGTSDNMELQITVNGKDVELNTSKTSYSVNKIGISKSLSSTKATQFYWSQADGFWTEGELTTDNILGWDLENEGGDKYLPYSIWIISRDQTGAYDLVKTYPLWDQDKCLSTDSKKCPSASYDL